MMSDEDLEIDFEDKVLERVIFYNSNNNNSFY